jgi:phage N-6-adenine-methyltransferase
MHGLIGPRAVLQAIDIEWWTPARYVDLARKVMTGIDLDPASCAEANKHVRAGTFFDRNTDGLTREWQGRIWLNPPYGKDAKRFIEHLLRECEADRVQQAIVLLNCNSIETKWFAPLRQFPLCFTKGRIHFISPNTPTRAATHGSVFVYLGPRQKTFVRVFSAIGDVFQRLEV